MTHDELVEAMCRAYLDEAERSGFCVEQHNHIQKQRIQGMSAALRVAVEEVLTNCYNTEADQAFSQWNNGHSTGRVLDDFLACRRSLYLKPKTTEDRVTVKEVHTTPLNYSPNCAFTCYVDGKPSGPLHSNREYAETFRLGLIAKLKEQGQ